MWKILNYLFGWDYCMVNEEISYLCRVYTNPLTDKRTARTPFRVYDVDHMNAQGIVFPLTYIPRYIR